MNPDWNARFANNFENPKILCNPIIFVMKCKKCLKLKFNHFLQNILWMNLTSPLKLQLTEPSFQSPQWCFNQFKVSTSLLPPPDNSSSICTFENFIPLNTFILKIKHVYFAGKTWQFWFKFLTPSRQDSNSQPSQGRKRNMFGLLWLNKKLGICFIPTNLMT